MGDRRCGEGVLLLYHRCGEGVLGGGGGGGREGGTSAGERGKGVLLQVKGGRGYFCR